MYRKKWCFSGWEAWKPVPRQGIQSSLTFICKNRFSQRALYILSKSEAVRASLGSRAGRVVWGFARGWGLGGAAGRALLAAVPPAASGAAARPLSAVLKGSEAAAGCSPRCWAGAGAAWWVGNYFPECMSLAAWYWLPKRTTGGQSGTGNITGTSQEALSVSILRYARESLSRQQQYFIHIGKILKNGFGFDCLKLTLGMHHTKLDDFFGDLYLKSVLKELHSYLLKDFIKLETKLSCHQIH